MTVTMEAADFGPYRLLAKVGQGPRGPVFVAQVSAAKAGDALYLLEVSGFATGEDAPLRGYLRDTESAARIQHRNVLGIVERGANAGGHYLVMPYLDAATLGELQDRHRAIRPPRLVIAAVIDALHGLHAAHAFRNDGIAQPLIHGSVSPDQMVIGLDGVCRIAGFGAARPRVQTKPSHRSSAATPYLSPEQIQGGELDPRSDLFAVGVVLWNALTGKKLFHDPVEHMAMSNVLERKVPRPSSVGLSPPRALDGFVLKALERDPAHRFQSAAEMAGALRDAARGAACLAAGSELADWIASSFGGELAVRRQAILELGTRIPQRGGEVAVLPALVAPPAADAAARDYLTLDELARAVEPGQRAASVPLPPSAPVPEPISVPAAPPRRRLVVVAVVAFVAVAGVLGWRWSRLAHPAVEVAALDPGASARPGAAKPRLGLDVTVLDVQTIAAAPPAVAVPTVASRPPGAVDPAPAKPAPSPPATIRTPPRSVRRPQRPPPATPRPADARAEPAAAEPAPEPAPPRPESPPRPTLESNPYLYNK